MNITEKNIVGNVVADDYRTASVFKKYGIDFCCNGNRSIEEACSVKKVDSNKLLSEITNVMNTSTSDVIDFKSWPTDLLVDYIEKKHHNYVETKITEIKPFLHKVSKVHGERHPELYEVNELFNASADELTMHMKKEEMILFPFIRKIVSSISKGEEIPAPHFGTVENPIEMMHHEHDIEGERFRKIAALTNDYTPPQDACNTYKVTFSMLKEFEDDLHQHIHLENNILFPKAIELEKSTR